MSTVFVSGNIGISSPYLLISISVIQCAKRLFTVIIPAAISLLLYAADLILIEKHKCTF